MAAVLPIIYAMVLILSGVAFGFALMYWYRGLDDQSLSELRLNTEQLRNSLQFAKQQNDEMQASFNGNQAKIESLRQKNSDAIRQVEKTNKAVEQQQEQFSQALERREQMFSMLRDEKRLKADLESKLSAQQLENSQLQDKVESISTFQNQTRCDFDKELAHLESELATTERELDQLREDHDAAQADLEQQKNRALVVTADLLAACNLLRMQTEISDINARNTDALRIENQTLKMQIATEVVPSETHEVPDVIRGDFGATPDNWDSEYQGTLQKHSVRGTIFTEKPLHRDDLKRIAGIAAKLEQKLNEQGIYTFKQIMNWDRAAIEDFSASLDTFQDRIERDNWVEQARYFYQRRQQDEKAA